MKHLLVALFAATAVSMSVRAEQPHLLLHDSFVTPDRAAAAERVASVRSRVVQADVGPLKPKELNRGQKKRLERMLSVAVFHDVRLQVVLDDVERTAVDSFAWTGRVAGDPASSVVVAVKDDAMSATFTTSGRRYVVRPLAGGLHEAHELDLAAFPDEAEPHIALANGSGSFSGQAIVAADGETLVDVIVAYTHVVREFLGSTSAAQTLATNAVTTTNTAYANSGVNMRVRLVGTAEYQYDDRTTDFSTTLSRFTGTADGFMDDVHALREQVGADAAGLLVYLPTDTGTCGIGWLMTNPGTGFAPYGFNVTRDDCAIGNLSFPHELGHNFGLQHDRANGSGASRTYAYGYQNPQRLFRTVMAYNCPNGGCPRIAHFSNPDINVSGAPTGINYLLANSADNARALNENRTFIAQWRSTVIPIPATFTDNPLVAGVTGVKALHVTELRTAINTLRASKGLAATVWATSAVTGGTITGAQITELRNALTPALSPAVPTYTDAALTNTTRVKATHIQELRNYLD